MLDARTGSCASATATSIHALGRSAAWSGYLAARLRGIPFLTSWYKGFRDQNIFKHLYNGIMARGDRVVAVSEQIAQLVNDRYGMPWERISVVPASIDVERFNPAEVARARVEAMRHAWGIKPDTKVILIVGRIVRRKGHHVVVKAAQRLKEMGFKDFLFVFVGEDHGRTHYTGELWDLVLATGTMDVIRMAAPVADMPAAYAAASAVVSAAVQPEGLQRAILEAQAMERPVVVSDLGAGPDIVLTPPVVPENRITGLRFHSGDDAALAATLLRLFSLPEPARRAMGSARPRLGARPFQCSSGRRADAAALWRDHRPRKNAGPGAAIATKLEIFERFDRNSGHFCHHDRRNHVDLFVVSTNLSLPEALMGVPACRNSLRRKKPFVVR